MINFQTFPVLFKLGNYNIYTYGMLLFLAALATLFLVLKQAEKKKINEKHVYNLLFFIILFSVLFARIFYILFNLNEFNSLIDVIAVWNGGLLSIGAFFGGVLGAFMYSKIAKINFLIFLDMFAPSVALSAALGRIGCFIRGCCFGLPTTLPWGILYSKDSLASQAGFNVPLHPTQLYESIADFIIFFILIKRQKTNKKSGSLFLLFLILLSATRFLIDFFRYYPAKEVISIHLTVFQLVYGIVFLISGFLYLKTRR